MYKAKLVFFDNMYMYDGSDLSNMTEDTPISPSSEKGKIRQLVANKILNAINEGKIEAIIARAPDFIGTHNSVLGDMICKNLLLGKKAMLMCSDTKKRNVTYTPDAAKAMAMLGNTARAFNQIWHIPSTHVAPTGKEWVELFANELGVEPKYTVLKKGTMGLLGIFVPVLNEFKEMSYQYEQDYFFNSSKFEKAFNFAPTSVEVAIKQVVADYRKLLNNV